MLYVIILVFVGVFIFGCWWQTNNSSYGDVGGAVTALIAGILLFVIGLAWVGHYIDTTNIIAKYSATKLTVEQSRDMGYDPLERATIQKDVLAFNQSIASAQYWNTTLFGPMFPDAVMQLELIK